MTSALGEGRRGKEPEWYPTTRIWQTSAPPALKAWLLDTSSLTRRLQAVCCGALRVRVRHQAWGRAAFSERRLLNLAGGARTLIREVHLLCDDNPWVYARTLIPATTVRKLPSLTRLGTRPLGAALFADRGLRRGPVEIARLTAGHALFHAACAGPALPQAIWGRRSLFWLRGKPLLVSEFFLPALLRRHSRM